MFGVPNLPPYHTGDNDPEKPHIPKDIAFVLAVIFIAYGTYAYFTKKVVNLVGIFFLKRYHYLSQFNTIVHLSGKPEDGDPVLFQVNLEFYFFIGFIFLIIFLFSKKPENIP